MANLSEIKKDSNWGDTAFKLSKCQCGLGEG